MSTRPSGLRRARLRRRGEAGQGVEVAGAVVRSGRRPKSLMYPAVVEVLSWPTWWAMSSSEAPPYAYERGDDRSPADGRPQARRLEAGLLSGRGDDLRDHLRVTIRPSVVVKTRSRLLPAYCCGAAHRSPAAARSTSWCSRRRLSEATTPGASGCTPVAPEVLVSPSTMPTPSTYTAARTTRAVALSRSTSCQARPNTSETLQPWTKSNAIAAPSRRRDAAPSSACTSSGEIARPPDLGTRGGLTRCRDVDGHEPEVLRCAQHSHEGRAGVGDGGRRQMIEERGLPGRHLFSSELGYEFLAEDAVESVDAVGVLAERRSPDAVPLLVEPPLPRRRLLSSSGARIASVLGWWRRPCRRRPPGPLPADQQLPRASDREPIVAGQSDRSSWRATNRPRSVDAADSVRRLPSDRDGAVGGGHPLALGPSRHPFPLRSKPLTGSNAGSNALQTLPDDRRQRKN